MKKIMLNEKQKKLLKQVSITASIIGGTIIILKIIDKSGVGEKLCNVAIEKLVIHMGTVHKRQYYCVSYFSENIPEEVINKIYESSAEILKPYIQIKK